MVPMRISLSSAFAALLVSATAVRADNAATGLWIDHTGRGAVEITDCSGKLCGHVAWLKDTENNDQCGKQIIGDVESIGTNKWDHGWIYDPDRGSKYDVAISTIGTDKLKVVGYAGTKWLSETYTWKRASADLQKCSKDGTAAQATPSTAAPKVESAKVDGKADALKTDDKTDTPKTDTAKAYRQSIGAMIEERLNTFRNQPIEPGQPMDLEAENRLRLALLQTAPVEQTRRFVFQTIHAPHAPPPDLPKIEWRVWCLKHCCKVPATSATIFPPPVLFPESRVRAVSTTTAGARDFPRQSSAYSPAQTCS